MPRLSDTMEEGTVAKWFKKVGDSIKEGDILAEIETDKATMEFESFYEGNLLHIGVVEGQTAPVDSLLAIIGNKGEDITSHIGKQNVSPEASNNNIDSEDKNTNDNDEFDFKESNVEIVNMPRLSDTMEEGVVASWNKKVGDSIKEGEILAEIETDKATMEFESFYSGYLLYIGVNEGESALVDSILAIIGDKDTDVNKVLKSLKTKNPNNIDPEKTVEKNELVIEINDSDKKEKEIIDSDVVSNERIIASPLAKKMATERGINISEIVGSGDNGRIIKRDIENFKSLNISSKTSLISNAKESLVEFANSQMRKTIAKRLTQSKFSAPHYYLGVEFQMDNMISFRNQYNNLNESKVSFNDLIVKATARALKSHPEVNSRWYEDKIVHYNHINIGVAVAVDEGLVVPVVKHADKKSLFDIGEEVKDFASRARSKKLTPAEMDGSTFTISNLGMFGISEFTSIINQPNSAILSIGSIIKKPIVREDKIVIGNTMKLTLACDHRTVDGAMGSLFLKTLRNIIENPLAILL